MSYDVGMEIDTGGKSPVEVGEWHNYTYNVSPMFRAAFGGNGINDLDGLRGEEAAPRLVAAILYMERHIEEMRALNPPNGWGSADGALMFLRSVLQQTERHPKAYVRVC